MVSLTFLTGCKTCPDYEPVNPIEIPLPDPPEKPEYEFRVDEEQGLLYITGEDGKLLALYITELQSYSEELREILLSWKTGIVE